MARNPFFPPPRNSDDSTEVIVQGELIDQAGRLQPGESVRIYEDGKTRWWDQPKKTITRTEAGDLEIYDGDSTIFSTPKKRITTSRSDECFVATAVYGGADFPQVQVLRDFRDGVLKKSFAGHAFVDFYYSGVGRFAANLIKQHLPSTIPVIRMGLDILVSTYSSRNGNPRE